MTTHEMIDILEGIIRDESTNATARCTAIRTLMQIEDDGGSRELDEEASGFAELDAFAPRRRLTDRTSLDAPPPIARVVFRASVTTS